MYPYVVVPVALLSLIFVSCASVPPICKPEGAEAAGISQAMRGEDISHHPGNVCEDEHKVTFRNHFESGYQKGRLKYCDPAEVERVALSRGQNGEATPFAKENYRICDSTADLHAAYKRGHAKGLAEFCAEDRATKVGVAQGEAGGQKEFPQTFAVCGAGKVGRLKAAFQKGYRDGNAKFCRGDGIHEEGLRDGGAGKEAAVTETRFAACGEKERKKISKHYLEGYNSALMQYCSGSNIERAARESAQNTNSAALPAPFAVCFQKFPELKPQYESVFGEERTRVVESRCTFHNGMEAGKGNAKSSNDRNTQMPAFCNQALYPTYLQGYLEGWKVGKTELCDPNRAYEEGVRRGNFSSSVLENYDPPQLCPSEYGVSMAQKFREGFQYSHQLKQTQAGTQLVSNDFDCRTEVSRRSGEHDFNRCPGSNRIACYQEMRETCRHKTSGQSRVRNFQQHDGRCVASFSGCW